MKYKTIKEAAQNWVREFNAIPYSIIEKLLEGNIDELTEITPPAVTDRVYLWGCGEYGEIIEADGETFTVELDNGETINAEEDEIEVQRDYSLPVWGTFWAFSDSCDNYWIEECGGLQAMANCGFRIYEQEDYTYVFGIDGAGYDFYEAHWIPLYKARGLKWHEEEDSEKCRNI